MTLRAILVRLHTMAAAVMILLAASQALASPILVASVSTLPDDTFLYTYELINPADESENVFDLGLFFEGDPLNVSAPTGWDYIAGLGFIDWFSLAPETDLAPGASLRGFSFQSPFAAGTIAYQTLGVNAVTGDVGTPVFGETDGPVSAVPEPSTVGLLGIGIAGVLLRRRRSPG